MAEECKCSIVVRDRRRDRPIVAEIRYCPKHAAVDDLLAALERIKAQKCYCYVHGGEEEDPDCFHELARDAIRKAKPKP